MDIQILLFFSYSAGRLKKINSRAFPFKGMAMSIDLFTIFTNLLYKMSKELAVVAGGGC